MGFCAGAAILGLSALFSGCSSSSGAMLRTLQRAYRSEDTAHVRLNPNFSYLRITLKERVAFLARGYVDPDPRGPIEVWYSAEREVLRLQNGRLIGASGLTTEWARVELPELPSWALLARRADEFRWTRVRDLMPGYRYGIRDELAVRVVPAPAKTALLGVDPRSLTWFEETVAIPYSSGGSNLAGIKASPELDLAPARYAVEFRGGEEVVVYGEQCLRAGLCFTWQRWQAQPRGSLEGQ